MSDPEPRKCLHCDLSLINVRPWPELGEVGECPKCNSSFTRKFSTAAEREDRFWLAFTDAVKNQRVAGGSFDRWPRALEVIARAYHREKGHTKAKELEGYASLLRSAMARAVGVAREQMLSAMQAVAA